jgi:hypothetical protein
MSFQFWDALQNFISSHKNRKYFKKYFLNLFEILLQKIKFPDKPFVDDFGKKKNKKKFKKLNILNK